MLLAAVLLGTAGCGEAEEPMGPAPRLDVAAEGIQLLPFAVRMNKLAHVVGRPLSDPMFETALSQSTALGAHDYARSLRPDRRWSARKMGVWVKSLLPVCTSDAFTSKYPDPIGAPDLLFEHAHGRSPTDVELEVLSSAGDPAHACLTVLTSLEFVSQ